MSLFFNIFFDGFCQTKKSKLGGTWILESSIFNTGGVYKEDVNDKMKMKIVAPGYLIFIIKALIIFSSTLLAEEP